jgi:hypothetical protein
MKVLLVLGIVITAVRQGLKEGKPGCAVAAPLNEASQAIHLVEFIRPKIRKDRRNLIGPSGWGTTFLTPVILFLQVRSTAASKEMPILKIQRA